MSFPQEHRRRHIGMLALAAVTVAGCSGDDDSKPLLTLDAREEALCLRFDPDPPVEVDTLPEVPCGEPHTHEVYAVLDFVEVSNRDPQSTVTDVYPGVEALESFGRRECLAAFQDVVGISALDSEMFYSWILPTLTSWEDAGDREVLCVAANRDKSDLEPGSIEGTKR